MFVTQHTTLPRKRAAQKDKELKAAVLDATNTATAVTVALAEVMQLVASLEMRVAALETKAK